MSDDFPGDEDKSPMPEERFPDGFGMSVEDVRALLAKNMTYLFRRMTPY